MAGVAAVVVEGAAVVEVVAAMTIFRIRTAPGVEAEVRAARVHLAQAEAVARQRINERLMLSGVTLQNPGSTYVDATVTVGRDTVIQPNCYLYGDTHIGEINVIPWSAHGGYALYALVSSPLAMASAARKVASA